MCVCNPVSVWFPCWFVCFLIVLEWYLFLLPLFCCSNKHLESVRYPDETAHFFGLSWNAASYQVLLAEILKDYHECLWVFLVCDWCAVKLLKHENDVYLYRRLIIFTEVFISIMHDTFVVVGIPSWGMLIHWASVKLISTPRRNVLLDDLYVFVSVSSGLKSLFFDSVPLLCGFEHDGNFWFDPLRN